MNLIDTHCHIYSAEFDTDLPAMVSRAENEGITKMLMPAIDCSSHEAMLAVETEYGDKCLSMMGLHPCSVKENYVDELKVAESNFSKREFVAVGETGLDFYWDVSFKKEQYTAFQQQIEWALQFDIPIIIHSRNSIDECIATISQHQKGDLKGVFHCFSGSHDEAKKIVDLNFYLGIGGVLTYKKSGLDTVIEQVDLKHIVLETDAPYLAPVPFRGKRNECSYLKFISEKLAEVKKMSVEEIADITTANARTLFNI